MVVLLQQSVPQTYATCFFKKYSTSEKKECNITLKWSFNRCKNLFKYSRPTSVHTADHFFEKCICLSKKIRGVYSGRMKTDGVFLLQDSFTLRYLSGLIWINPKPKEKMATTLVSGLVARPFILLFFFVFLLVSTKGRHMPILP